MSRDDNKKNPNPKMSEEAAIFNTFATVVKNKFSSTQIPESPTESASSSSSTLSAEEKVKRLDEIYNGPDYAAEKKMLQEMNNNGLVKGLLCGLASFVFLRRGPRITQRYLNRSHNRTNGGSAGGYVFDNVGMNPGGTGNPTAPRPGLFFRTIKLALDLGFSTSIFMFCSSYFTNKKKLMADMSQIPLVEGRSLISDELCDDFIDVYRGIPKKTWDKYNGKSEPLDAISSFVMNCIRRKTVEKQILEQNRSFGMSIDMDNDAESGKSHEKHVAIPSPGVSSDIPVAIAWGDSSEDVDVGTEGEDVFLEFEDDFSDFSGLDDDDDGSGSFGKK